MDAFIFSDGTVVLWGLDHIMRDEVLSVVSAFREQADGTARSPEPVSEVLQLRSGDEVRVFGIGVDGVCGVYGVIGLGR